MCPFRVANYRSRGAIKSCSREGCIVRDVGSIQKEQFRKRQEIPFESLAHLSTLLSGKLMKVNLHPRFPTRPWAMRRRGLGYLAGSWGIRAMRGAGGEVVRVNSGRRRDGDGDGGEEVALAEGDIWRDGAGRAIA